ncbi:MAG: polyhydroxyalkanoate synthesis regulator DNA-binding domain-containing protein, partial [Oligoflexia bacterium]|nr:polyhydroxyalkanoate synthesis regulator DNA-binding domain-containing protein [Oligoflexia bacterium]
MSHISFHNSNHNRPEGPKIIKKYGNRKLYDTQQSSYVVLKDIEKMIRNKEDIQIIDNETQDDITVPTLTQIIFSSEKKSKISPPVNVLKSIIREGDGSF